MDFTILEARRFDSTYGGYVQRKVKDYEIDLECSDGRVYSFGEVQNVILHPGDVLIRIPQGVVTATGAQSSLMLTLDFSQKSDADRYSRNTPGPFQEKSENELIAHLPPILHPAHVNDVTQIYRKLVGLPNRQSPIAEALVRELLFLLNAEAEKRRCENLDPRQSVAGKLIAYMQAHLADRVTLDDLSKEVCLEKSYLLRVFRRETGRSPMESLIAMRLEKASDLVAATELPICEIAAECGYRSSSFFISSYKDRYGVSPEAHRKSLKQQKNGT